MKEVALIIIVLAILVGLATGCYAISSSIGQSIEINARQSQVERQQYQRQQQQRFELDLQQQRLLAPVVVRNWANFLTSLSLAGIVLVIVATVAGSWWIVSEVQARRKHALIMANTISLDRITRQYPLIPYQIGGNIRVYNPNINSVVDPAQLSAGQPMLITAQSLAQVAGLLAAAAANSKNQDAPDAIAAISPPLVIDNP